MCALTIGNGRFRATAVLCHAFVTHLAHHLNEASHEHDEGAERFVLLDELVAEVHDDQAPRADHAPRMGPGSSAHMRARLVTLQTLHERGEARDLVEVERVYAQSLEVEVEVQVRRDDRKRLVSCQPGHRSIG